MKHDGSVAAAAGLCVWVLSALLAGLAAAWQSRANERQAADHLDALTGRITARIGERLGGYERGVRGARGMVAAVGSEALTRDAFLRYAATREVDREFPGVRGFGVVWRVSPADEAAFVASARADGWPSFQIRKLGANDGERYVIRYVEPVERNQAAVGLDIASEPSRRAAARSSMRTGEATLTAPITLVQAEGSPSRAFLLLLPIFPPGPVPETADGREATGVGWAYAPLVMDEVLAGLEGEVGGCVLTVGDLDSGDGPFYTSAGSAGQGVPGLTASRPLPIYGRAWQVGLAATPAFVDALGQRRPAEAGAITALGGALLAALLTVVPHLRQRTRAARLEQARRSAIVEASEDAIVAATVDGVVTDWNGGAERLFGWSAAEAVGRPVAELLGTDDGDLRVAGTSRVAPFDTVRRHRDGTPIAVSVTAAPIREADGRCVGFATTLRDVRASHAARRALVELNATLEEQVAERTAALKAALHDLRSIVDALPSAIGYWDAGAVNRMANRACGAWFGLDPERLPGRHLSEVADGAVFARLWPRVEAALRGEAQTFEGELPAPGGSTRHVVAHLKPDVDDAGVRGLYVLVHDVSELVLGQRRLAAAERANDALLRTIRQHFLVSVSAPDGSIVDVNDAFCARTGYAREELVGQDHRLLNGGQNPPGFWQEMWRVVRGGSPWRADVCNRAKDGSLFWVDTIIAPLFDASGTVERLLSIRSDISARHELETRLQQTNARLQLAARAFGLGVWEYDVVAGGLVWDDRMHELYGSDPSGGQEPYALWSTRLHPDDRERAERELQDALADRRPFDTTFRIALPDGRVRHLKAAAQVVRDATGQPLRMTGINLDVSERAQLDAELSATLTLLHAVLDSATEASIVATRPDGVISVFNAGAQKLLGYTAAEVVGHRRAQRFHDPGELEARAADLGRDLGRSVPSARVLTDPAVLGHAQEWTYSRRDGSSVPVSLTVTEMREPDGSLFGYLGIAHDISRQKEHERQLQQAAARATAASRAKSEFLANTSHEIRTPMNALIGLTHLLEHTPLDADQADLVRKVRVAGRSLLALLNDVLDLSKIEAGELRLERVPFALDVVLGELQSLVAVQAEAKGVPFSIVAPRLDHALEGDPTRLQQILLNLVHNALKFTERGEVRLEVDAASVGHRVDLRFAVIDTGIGIAPAARARLFEPFVQADASTTRRFGGSGLGLSIVSQLVGRMGGRVEVTSDVGVGSRFAVELSLPRAEGDLAPAAPDDPGADAGRALSGVRVLVVDDSEINREVASRVLALHGAVVAEAADGRQAVERLAAAPDAFDVVLMDVQMPVLSGFEAARTLRTALRLTDLPILGLTAATVGAEERASEAAGMTAILAKPFDPPALVACIARHARRHDGAAPAGPCDLGSGAPTGWPSIDGIDRRDACRRLLGDVPLFRAMLRRLLEDSEDLREVARSGDAAVLAARLHELKGSAGTLGARAVQALAASTEEAARRRDEGALRAALHEVADHLDRLRAASSVFLAERDGSAEGTPDGPAGGGELSSQVIDELLALLQGADLRATERFAALGPQLRARFGVRDAASLLTEVEELRFEEASQRLTALASAA